MSIGRHLGPTLLLGVLAFAAPASAAPFATQTELQQAGFRLHWEANLPLSDGDSIGDGYLVDDVLYVTTDLGRLFAVTSESGLIRWAHVVTEPDYRIFPPSHMVTEDDNSPVIVPTATRTLIYDRYTGELIQRYTPKYANAGPVVAGDNIVLSGSIVPRVTALRVGLSNNAQTLLLWEVSTDAPVTTRPLLINNSDVVFATRGGTVYRCAGVDKELRFATDVGGPIVSDPVFDATGIYVASIDRSLYKLDRGNGRILWRVRFQEPLRTGPIVLDGLVYQYSPKEGMTAVEADSGEVRWRRPECIRFVSRSKAGVTMWTADGNLAVIDPETGEAVTGITTLDVHGVVSNTQNDAAFLLGRDGTINALRLGDIPYLKRQEILAARRKLNQKPAERQTLIDQPKVPDRTERRRDDDPLRSKRDIQR